jgi:hypothetical protein
VRQRCAASDNLQRDALTERLDMIVEQQHTTNRLLAQLHTHLAVTSKATAEINQ